MLDKKDSCMKQSMSFDLRNILCNHTLKKKKLYFHFMCVRALSVHMSVYHVCVL